MSCHIKKEQIKTKYAPKKGKTKISIEINEVANRETMGKLMKPKINSMKRSI